MAKGDVVPICRLMIIDTAQDNGDGTFTTEDIHNTKYPGGTNQVKLKKVTVENKEVFLVNEFL